MCEKECIKIVIEMCKNIKYGNKTNFLYEFSSNRWSPVSHSNRRYKLGHIGCFMPSDNVIVFVEDSSSSLSS